MADNMFGKVKLTPEDVANATGWSQQGTDRYAELAGRPQQAVFAPINALQKGKSLKDATVESAKAILGKSPKITGGDLAGNVQEKYGVQNKYALAGLAAASAAADTFVDPMQLVTPSLGKKSSLLGGTVADVAKQAEVKNLASNILATGNVDALHAIGQANNAQLGESLAGLSGGFSREIPTARNVIEGTRIPASLPAGTTGVLKSSSIAPVLEPGIVSGGVVPINSATTKVITNVNPSESLATKINMAKSSGVPLELPLGLNSDQAKQARQILEAQGIKVKGVGPK